MGSTEIRAEAPATAQPVGVPQCTGWTGVRSKVRARAQRFSLSMRKRTPPVTCQLSVMLTSNPALALDLVDDIVKRAEAIGKEKAADDAGAKKAEELLSHVCASSSWDSMERGRTQVCVLRSVARRMRKRFQVGRRTIFNKSYWGCGCFSKDVGLDRGHVCLAPALPVSAATRDGSRLRQSYLARIGVRSATCSQRALPCSQRAAGEVCCALLPPPPQDFRLAFLQKLSYQRVLLPRAVQTPRSQTAIIFDWDDTLLCTSFLQECGARPGARDVCTPLRHVHAAARHLLEDAFRFGQVFIVTNAAEGWVAASAESFAPELLPAVLSLGARVISARKYEAEYPGDFFSWKEHAFMEVQRELSTGLPTNLISLGDSNYEMEAAHHIAQTFEHITVKTVKFNERPSPLELMHQLRLVRRELSKIVECGHGMDVAFERSRCAGSAPQRIVSYKHAALPRSTTLRGQGSQTAALALER